MELFIINSFVFLGGLVYIVTQYFTIKNQTVEYEKRLRLFVISRMILFLIASVSVALSMIASKILIIEYSSLNTAISAILAAGIYAAILFWYKKLQLLLKTDKQRRKNIELGLENSMKSMSIYALLYAFSIMFYVLHFFAYFEI